MPKTRYRVGEQLKTIIMEIVRRSISAAAFVLALFAAFAFAAPETVNTPAWGKVGNQCQEGELIQPPSGQCNGEQFTCLVRIGSQTVPASASPADCEEGDFLMYN